MSSSDDKIIQSVDAIISAVGQLVDEIKAANDLDQQKKAIALEKVSSVARQMDEINHAIFVDAAVLNDATLDEVTLAENSLVETSPDEQDVVAPRVVPLPLPVIGGGELNDEKPQDEFELADETRDTPWSEGDEVADAGVSEAEIHVETAEIEIINDEDGSLKDGESYEEVKQPRLVLTPIAQPDGDEETVQAESGVQLHSVLESETEAAADNVEDDHNLQDFHSDEQHADEYNERGRENNLQLIKGIDEEVEALLDRNGISSFQDISAFKEADIIWISEALGEPDRVARENWIEQAALLAADTHTSYSLKQTDTEFFSRLSLIEAYSDRSAEQEEMAPYDTAAVIDDEMETEEQVPELNQDVFNALASDYLDTVGEPPAFLKQDEDVQDGEAVVGSETSDEANFSDREDIASRQDAETNGLTSIGFVPNLIKKLVTDEGAEESRTSEPGMFEDEAAQDEAVGTDDMSPTVFDQHSDLDAVEDAEDADSAFISQTLMDKKRELEAELAALTAQMHHQTAQEEKSFSEPPEEHHSEWPDDSFAQRTEKQPVVEILDHQDGDGALTVPFTGDESGDDGLPPDTGAIWHEEVSTAAGYVPPIVNDEDDYADSEQEHASSFEAGGFENEPFVDDSFEMNAQDYGEDETSSDLAVGQDHDEVFESSDIALPIGQRAGASGADHMGENEFSEDDLASLEAGEEEDYWSAVAGADHQGADFSDYEGELPSSSEIDDRMTDPEIEVPAQRGFLAVPAEQPELSAAMTAVHDEMDNDHDGRYENGRADFMTKVDRAEDDKAKVGEAEADATEFAVSSQHIASQPLGMYLARKLPQNGSEDEFEEPVAEFSREDSGNANNTENESPVMPPELPGSGAPFAGPPVMPPVPVRSGAGLGTMPPPQPPVQPASGGYDRDGRHEQHSLRAQGEAHGDGLPGEARGGPRRLPAAREGMPPVPGDRPPGGLARGVSGRPPLPPMAASEHISGSPSEHLSGHLSAPPSGPPQGGAPLGPPVVPHLAQEGPAGRNGAYRGNGRDSGMRPAPNREMGRNGFPQRPPQRYPLRDGQPPVRHENSRAEGFNNGNGEIPAWSEFSDNAQDRPPQKGKGVSEGFRERAKKFAENLQKSLVEKE